jgi:exonuclease SbcC
MIPVEIQLHNFLPYRDPPDLILEGVHVACLAGENGAGKSSILDAITWALWGKARSNSPDELIHQGEDEMRVALTFLQGEERIRVIRQRKAGKRGSSLLELQVWDTSVDSWRGLSEATIRGTQTRIDELLRLDYETFVNSAFLLQGRADEFTTKTPAQRKQVLANILGLDVWEVYEKRARERMTATKASIERLDGRLEEIEKELAQREAYDHELSAAQQNAQELGARLDSSEKEWASLEETRAELVAYQRQVDDLTRRIGQREAELLEARKELTVAEQRADQEAILGTLESVRASLTTLDPLREQLQALEREREKTAAEAATLRGINEALGPETEPIKARVETLQAAEEPICPTCNQPLSEEHSHALIEELEADIAARREQYRQNREQIATLEGRLNELDQKRQELDVQLAERPELVKRIGELETAVNHAEQAQDQVRTLEKRIKRWQGDLQVDTSERSKVEELADQSEARLRSASLTQDDLDRMRAEKRMADERVGAARQKLATLKAFEEQRKLRAEEREAEALAFGAYEQLREAFSKRGVPAMIIETAVPELERTANELLARMTEGRMHVRIETQREIKTGELREALDIIISDELGSRPYELYSGGESFRIDFAIRIALSRLLANRAGAQLRSLFIDEGFGTQDARGREYLVSAINSIQDDFDLILVITHIDELKEAFPTRIEVTKSADGSMYQLA